MTNKVAGWRDSNENRFCGRKFALVSEFCLFYLKLEN